MPEPKNSTQRAGLLLLAIGLVVLALVGVGELALLGLDNIDQSLDRFLASVTPQRQDLVVLGQAATGLLGFLGGLSLLLVGGVLVKLSRQQSPVAQTEAVPWDKAA